MLCVVVWRSGRTRYGGSARGKRSAAELAESHSPVTYPLTAVTSDGGGLGGGGIGRGDLHDPGGRDRRRSGGDLVRGRRREDGRAARHAELPLGWVAGLAPRANHLGGRGRGGLGGRGDGRSRGHFRGGLESSRGCGRDHTGGGRLEPSAAILAENEVARIVPSAAVANHGRKGDPATSSESSSHFNPVAVLRRRTPGGPATAARTSPLPCAVTPERVPRLERDRKPPEVRDTRVPLLPRPVRPLEKQHRTIGGRHAHHGRSR